MSKKTNNIIWSDQKRHFGLPLSFTRYSLSPNRLFLSVGLLSVKDDELLLYRVRDISVRRGLFQRIFGVGTITIMSSDRSHPELILKNIKNPMKVKENIHAQVEAQKTQRRLRVAEISTLDVDDDDSEGGE